jgi:prephenate dehydrogenase
VRRSQSGPNAIGIVGLGLIGGSLAKAIARRYPKKTLIGVEPSARTRRLAAKDGIFDRLLARPSAELHRCEIVVLCAPVPAILRLLRPVSRRMRNGSLLIDVGGVKEPIVAAARTSVRAGVRFVGTHPMFGGEKGGYDAAHKELWRGGVVAVCTDGGALRSVRAAARLHRSLGARVILCRASAHDRAVAAVSHLPYVVASALVLTARDTGNLARQLAGRGFADTARLARFAFGIQTEAARRNSRLPAAARSFEINFRLLRTLLRASPAKASALFARARSASESFTRRS